MTFNSEMPVGGTRIALAVNSKGRLEQRNLTTGRSIELRYPWEISGRAPVMEERFDDLDEIERTLRQFIYEMNQIITSRGNNFPNVILSTTPTILQSLIDVPAIGAHGEIIGKYGDFKDECFKLFNALINIYIKGDYNQY